MKTRTSIYRRLYPLMTFVLLTLLLGAGLYIPPRYDTATVRIAYAGEPATTTTTTEFGTLFV